MDEQPVNDWTRTVSPIMTVPPVFPPALRKSWAAGRPVGVEIISSILVTQKHMEIVKIQPRMPDTKTAT